ncbi:MAG: tRNA 2-selenouridine synthase [Paraglaciecola sp.]|jgi:tRNA 2-selenouridine synthase
MPNKVDEYSSGDFSQLFLHDTPMIDTRSPGEFARGSFPHAVNLPLMLDDERAKVGTCYKQQGQAAAISLGHKLVCGEIKQQRVQRWTEFAQVHPHGYLFCWRGGLRSEISLQWLREVGIEYPRVPGGYKVLRRFLIDQTEAIIQARPLILLAGRTGSGKTHVLNSLPSSIDLEGLAQHRGSSFGQRPIGQPSQISFENRLAIALLKQTAASSQSLLLEDEGSFIGRCSLPLNLYKQMKQSPRILLDVPLEDRINTILNDYIVDLYDEYLSVYQEQGFGLFASMLRSGLQRIAKRLGGQRTMSISKILDEALARQLSHGETSMHKIWIEELLVNYYDPSYDYQLSRNEQPILFKGDADEVMQYLS